jgi:hypothetical protein
VASLPGQTMVPMRRASRRRPLVAFQRRRRNSCRMSGSPVLLSDISAIGIVCAAAGTDPRVYTEGGPNPRLADNLPGWPLRSTDTKPPSSRRLCSYLVSGALLLSALCWAVTYTSPRCRLHDIPKASAGIEPHRHCQGSGVVRIAGALVPAWISP